MSKLVMCPGCDNIIEDTDILNNCNTCPKCGLSFDDTEKLEDLRKIYICPLCGDYYSNVDYRNYSGKCKYCNFDLIKTNATYKEYSDIYQNDDVKSATRIFANKYGNFQFSDTAYDRRMATIQEERRQREAAKNPPKPQQHCPVCNSTNIQKISVTSKAVGAGLFGIFSKTARSQFECKDCGYKF